MRQKAEQKIREAVTRVGAGEYHPLAAVRRHAGLHSKVFDKTILDMERVGTISLFAGDLKGMPPAVISQCVRKGDTVYTAFRFVDGTREVPIHAAPRQAPPLEQERDAIIVVMPDLAQEEWLLFEILCRRKSGRSPETELARLVRDYIRENV